MARKALATVTVMFMLAMTALVASADSPRFSRISSGVDADGNLSVSFRETGLGNTPDPVQYLVEGTATVTYACINGGGNHPKAANKQTSSSPISQGAEFVPDNGNVDETITVNVPGPGSFSCPGGQRLELVCVTYSGMTLTDTDHDVSTGVPGASYLDPVFGRFCP